MQPASLCQSCPPGSPAFWCTVHGNLALLPLNRHKIVQTASFRAVHPVVLLYALRKSSNAQPVSVKQLANKRDTLVEHC